MDSAHSRLQKWFGSEHTCVDVYMIGDPAKLLSKPMKRFPGAEVIVDLELD